jgi:hypothetical protein
VVTRCRRRRHGRPRPAMMRDEIIVLVNPLAAAHL